MRVTEQELAKFQKNSGRAAKSSGKEPKKRKYANVRTQVDGIWFDSKLEARRYGELKMLKSAGQVEWFLMQVPFHLSGGIVYRADFFIKWRSTLLVEPRITVEDCKGERKGASNDTALSEMKRKQVKALYGIEVLLVSAAGDR